MERRSIVGLRANVAVVFSTQRPTIAITDFSYNLVSRQRSMNHGWTLVVVAAGTLVACAPALIAPGSTYRSHKLISVEGGAALAHMPIPPTSCGRGTDLLAAASEFLTGTRRHFVVEFTVRTDGSVDSVRVTGAGDPRISTAIVEYLTSCAYGPAQTQTGQPVATRVQRTVLLIKRPR